MMLNRWFLLLLAGLLWSSVFGVFYGDPDPPEPITIVRPEYPDSAKIHKITGTVVLDVEIFKDGSVGNIIVVESLQSGSGGLDEAAIKAVKLWKFQPSRSGGKPVDRKVMIPLEFSLVNDEYYNTKIKIKVKPKDARVELLSGSKSVYNGIGTTKITVELYKIYQLKVSKAGYERYEEEFNLNTWGSHKRNITLNPSEKLNNDIGKRVY